ncbi:MAG: tryptophan synthase subunit alpha [Candidatus Aenigmarchaeota archaeon]|nr:tryptophan synthase subunit alpha [Candidatus Aenigmarchaeota archaeon]
MSRIAEVFAKKKAFIPFTVVGDPDYETSKKIIKTMIDSGADMLELGFAFSDPVADGPTIQFADNRALDSGMKVDSAFRLIKEIRRDYSDIPIGLLVYANLVYNRGIDKFYSDAHDAGIDAVLVADIPYEEAKEYVEAADRNDVAPVFIVAQTTTDERFSRILKIAKGYIYLVSVLGVTGARGKVEEGTLELVKKVKLQTDLPVAVGFGISSKEQAKEIISAGADGVIVGSAIVKIIERNLDDVDGMLREIGGFVGEMKESI